MRPEPYEVARRLGFDETTIRRLQARGHLSRLALTEAEIRKRLNHAHLAAFPMALVLAARRRSPEAEIGA